MKVIDLFDKIAKGEEVPKHIRIDEHIYHFDCSDSDYYNDIENAPSLLERIWRHNAYVWLNLEVEIPKEDEFIDIEEFSISYNLDYIDYKNIDVLKNHLNKDFQTIFDTLDVLIKNQKKIIERLDKSE